MRFGYDHREVLRDVGFRVAGGEVCSVLGNNGAGKSTLLKCLLGILRPQAGSVELDGRDAARLSRREVARHMAYVAQQSEARERLTVFDTVLMGRRPHISWGVTERDLDVVQEIMGALDLDRLAMRHTDELSGGEAQKVAIARALAQEPRVLLLDEPTSNLDLRNQLEVLRTVRRAAEDRGIAALMAIHDINLALRFSDRFLLLKDGAILACGGPEVITQETIEETYGVRVSIEGANGGRMVVPR
jgi:iron complex transport system ATP-binding protein